MTEKDKLFFFMDGLQPWAEQELQRRGVRHLASALAAAERLVDVKAGEPSTKPKHDNFFNKGERRRVATRRRPRSRATRGSRKPTRGTLTASFAMGIFGQGTFEKEGLELGPE
ncbi:hypothetical protein H6P81_021205 [Aristolochia fimbriata]|uniref:Uncharacterized protein n=1 Tax=Aristolochia fimbriata TaxID=158543 RepID=A0AAV7DQT9_ARIFI|nr:hypothetical protein H6P81_021205 [Aristolochia fimbriata]